MVELLVVVVIIALLAALLLPAMSKVKTRAQAILCLNNTKQLSLGWHLYSDDFDGRLAYNLGGDASKKGGAPKSPLNWVNNIMTWELDSDNTNVVTITEASLAPYVAKSTSIYRCPSDNILSQIQKNAGWNYRIRSYSMNAMVGDAGELTTEGYNVNNRSYVQYFKMVHLTDPAQIFVFLDEHPDSIDDGYFVNRVYYNEWMDLPASYHNNSASFSFADGHAELHRWRHPSPPSRPDAASLPRPVPPTENADFDWVTSHMSVHRD